LIKKGGAIIGDSFPIDEGSVLINQESVPINENHVLIKRKRVLVDEKGVPMTGNCVPIDGNRVLIKRERVPIDQKGVPMTGNSVLALRNNLSSVVKTLSSGEESFRVNREPHSIGAERNGAYLGVSR
jgi:hypothetical protein